jgi:HK97 gp10 family phage protein
MAGGIEFSVSVEGLDKLVQNSVAIQRNVEAELAKGVYASAEQVATEYKRSILSGGKSGRIYKHRSVEHRASAPGEAPASDTGRLVNSISVALDSALSAVMKVATAYAMLLEFGTSKMAARPAATPALEKSRQWIIDRLQQAVRAGLG